MAHNKLHSESHIDGDDAIQDATNSQKGLATAAKITEIEANTTHRSSDGTDHSFINQDLKTNASPTFNDLTITGGDIVATTETVTMFSGTVTDLHLGPTVNNIDMGKGNGTVTANNDLTVTNDLTVGTDTLFVDASADKVGVGTIVPTEKLHIDAVIRADNSYLGGTKSTTGLVPTMTSASQSGYTISASSEYNASYAGWKAFDGNGGTDWATASITTNFWLKVQLPSATRIWKIAMQGRAGEENPIHFVIQGSTDNSTWYTVGGGYLNHNDWFHEFAVQHDTAYLYYRLYVHNGSGSNPGLRTMQLYEIS